MSAATKSGLQVVYVQPTPAERVRMEEGLNLLARLMLEVLEEMQAEREAAEFITPAA